MSDKKTIENVIDLDRLRALIDKEKARQVIADKIGCNVSLITRHYNAQKIVTVDFLKKYAEYFNVSADYLLGLTDAPTNDKDLRFVCDYTGLSEEAVKSIKYAEKNTLLSAGYNLLDINKVDKYIDQARPIISHILSNKQFYGLIAKQLIIRANKLRQIEILYEFDKAYDTVFSNEGKTPTEKDIGYVLKANDEVLKLYSETKAYAYDMQEDLKVIFPFFNDLPSRDKIDKLREVVHRWTYVRALEKANDNTGGADNG
ncbi:MAG: hypothetical protein IKD89_08275 [Clostridia bacterium]|nr:hypothetical protein [Clostridia bacterium]